jgi:hypothetical protein
VTDFAELGAAIGRLVNEKNKAYGNSFAKCGEFLRLLYPDGVKTEQYTDMLAIVRCWDKLMRIATHKDALGEDPWRDLVGYGLLSVANQVKPPNERERTFTAPYTNLAETVTCGNPTCACHNYTGANTYYCPHHGLVQRG